MTAPTRVEKIYFAVIFLSAIWISLFGLLLPTQLAAIFTWMTLPPLHARFLGAVYLFGAMIMLGSIFATGWKQIRAALITAAIWTGLIFVVSVLNLGAFDLSSFSAWAWLISYFVYPLAALFLAWNRTRSSRPPEIEDGSIRGWERSYLFVQGGVMVVLAVALLVAPGLVAPLWPWKVTALLAHFYSGPLLAFGYSSVEFARIGTAADRRTLYPAMLGFTVCVLLASFVHSSLFSIGDVSAWLWFSGFAIATLFLAAITVFGLARTSKGGNSPVAAS